MQRINPLSMCSTWIRSPYLSRPSLTLILSKAIVQLLDVMPILHCSKPLYEMYAYMLFQMLHSHSTRDQRAY